MNTAAIASIGIDLGKTVFYLVALDRHAKVIVRKKFSRSQLITYGANLPTSLIGMEACSGAHFLAAKLRDQGHDKRGSAYLRRMFIHGARAVLWRVKYDIGALREWTSQLQLRSAKNVVVVALANKLARIAWAVPGLSSDTPFPIIGDTV